MGDVAPGLAHHLVGKDDVLPEDGKQQWLGHGLEGGTREEAVL